MSEVKKELGKLFENEAEQDVLRRLFASSHHPVPVADGETLEVDEEPWVRGGGETYIMPFSVRNSDGESVRCLFKACVTFTPEASVNEWMQRRSALEGRGVQTPQVLGQGPGLILEEFVPYTFEEGYQRFGDEVLSKAARYFGSVASLGFKPVTHGIMRDLRVDEDKGVHMIDFGSDLGAPNAEPTDLWDTFVKDASVQLGLSAEDLQAYRDDYEAGLNM